MPEVKKAGRPRRLSTDEILEAGMKLLEAGGHKSLSIRRISQELNTSPGNLYTYFPDKQSILDALGEQAFSQMQFILDDSLAWDQQITQWMEQVHGQLLNSQDLIFLMGLAGTSPKSLSIIHAISQLLEHLGIESNQAILHAQSLLWTVMSFTLFEVQATESKVIKQLLDKADQSGLPDIVERIAIKDLTPLWKINLQRNIDGLRFQVINL